MDSNLSDVDNAAAQLRFFIRLFQLEKVLPPLPTVDDALTANFLGVDIELLRQIRAELSNEVDAVALSLLANPVVAEQVDRLPFTAGSIVVGLGDSLTADRQSWFEIIARIFLYRRPDHHVKFINAGVSGDTTTQMLARMPFLVAASPAYVLCLAGGNDARHFGSPDAPAQVSLRETRRNLAAIRAAMPNAEWLWLAPPEAIIERTASSPFWTSMQTFWRAESLAAISDLVCAQSDPCLDLRQLFGTPPQGELFLDDGLHPGIQGHALIARKVMETLADM